MIQLILKIPNLHQKWLKARPELPYVLAAAMQTNRAMMFDADGADNGKKKWKNPKFRSGRPLQNTGALRKSMGVINVSQKPTRTPGGVLNLTPTSVTIGSKLIYAKLMNDGTVHMPGGVLRPVNAQALKIPLPSGRQATATGKKLRKQHGNFMFLKSVKIPARPMDEITKRDEREFNETMANYIAQVLNDY